jgi:hypothetical protein
VPLLEWYLSRFYLDRRKVVVRVLSALLRTSAAVVFRGFYYEHVSRTKRRRWVSDQVVHLLFNHRVSAAVAAFVTER